MDEPTENLDPVVKTLFWKLIKLINKQNKVTFFISSHNLDEIEKTITHIVVIRLGVLSWQGDWNFKGGLRERFDRFNISNNPNVFSISINKELVNKINLLVKKNLIDKKEANQIKKNLF
jgi:ABC-type multidrug transport system ATPase subunit